MVTRRDPRVRTAPAYQLSKRRNRNPQHRFSLKIKPWQVQPFMIAPVLPGETMTNLLTQARITTDPLDPVTKLVGWHAEMYYFYVKHRDLPEGTVRDEVSSFVLDNTPIAAGLRDTAAVAWTYNFNGGVRWLQYSVQRIIEEYFRDENEAWNDATLDGVPMAAIYGKGSNDWMEKLTLASDARVDDFNLIEGGSLTPNEFIDRWNNWAAQRDAGLTQMDYEDFVRTYGSTTREEETSPNLHRPELLRYTRNWQYPTNVVEPTTGVPATAVNWSIAERVDKDYRFSEPGFIVGLVCCRPKIYIGKQAGSLVGGLDDVYSWLPAVLNQNYEAAYKEFDDAAGPLAGVFSENYIVDVRDLFLNGDQFVNYSITDKPGTVALPTAANQRRYPLATDIARLWKNNATANQILIDGVCHLTVKGYQEKGSSASQI